MESRSLCRVCLASDRAVYRLADTSLEETYERVTRETLVVEGRPCCVCSVCLSALRRCRRFVQVARRANIALDRWSRSPRMKMTLTETPLFTFTQSVTEVFDATLLCQQLLVKQESDNVDNMDIETAPDDEEIKCEVTDDEVDDDKKHIQNLDNSEIDNSNNDDPNLQLPKFECVNIYDNEINVGNKTEILVEVKLETSEDGVAPSTSNVKKDESSQEENPLQIVKCPKRVKNGDKSDPQVKKRRAVAATPKSKKTAPSAEFHRDGNMYSCLECSYKTKLKSSMQRHIMIHTGEKPFSCDNCDYKCSRKTYLKRHILIVHTVDKLNIEKPYACDKCDFKSWRKAYLKGHLLIHTSGKPYECNKCEFKGRRKIDLTHHLMIHTGEKPFACKYCDYKSNRKTNLIRHLVNHTGEKPFACDKCDFKGRREIDLKNHSVIHTSEKPFACDKCDFKTRRKIELNNHLSKHTGEKRFSCDKCDHKTNRKKSLITHLEIHTGDKPFACNKCNFKSKAKNHLLATSVILKQEEN